MTKRETKQKAHGMVVDTLFDLIENGEWPHDYADPDDAERVRDALVGIMNYHRLYRNASP